MSPVATSDSEIQSLTRDLRTGRCAVEVGTRSVVLAAALWLALRGPWFTAPVAFLTIGILQYHFLVLSHEAQHKLIARSPRLNDWLGKWVFAYPFGQAFLSERARHMKHHRTVGTPDDPDYHRYVLEDKRPWADMIRYYLRLATYGKVWEYLSTASSAAVPAGSAEAEGRSSREIMLVALVQVCLLGLFSSAASPIHYFLFWLAPVLMVTTTLSEFREFCEHVTTPSSPLTLKSFRAPRWQQHILAPVGFAQHGEHHLHPSVPHYLLDRVAAHYPTSTSTMEVHRSHFEIVRLCRADTAPSQ